MADLKQKVNINTETMSAIFIIIFIALFILANLSYGFVWPLYLLAMIFAIAVSMKYPRSGLLAIVFLTMIFERYFTLQTFFIGKVEYKIYPLDIIMVGIILGLFFQWLFKKEAAEKRPLGAVDYIFILFILINIVYFILSFFFLDGDKALAFSTLKNYGFYGLLYFITLSSIRGARDLKLLFQFFMAGATGIIIFVLVGIFQGTGLWSEFTPLSTSGVRLLAFTHGLYLALAILPATLYILARQSASKNPSRIARSDMLYIFIAIWAVGIIATLMRHLWIALALSLALVYFLLPREKKAILRKIASGYAAIVFILFSLIFYSSAMDPQSKLNASVRGVFGVVAERTESLGSISQDESYYWRTIVWKSAYENFKNNPVFGIGTGKKVYVENGKEYKDFVEVRNIHNSYLAILIQLGFFGLSIFALFVYLIWKRVLQAYRRDKNNIAALSVLSVLTVYIAAMFFQPYLETNLLSLFFWIALGAGRIISDKNWKSNLKMKP